LSAVDVTACTWCSARGMEMLLHVFGAVVQCKRNGDVAACTRCSARGNGDVTACYCMVGGVAQW